jgi:hypothetical protein
MSQFDRLNEALNYERDRHGILRMKPEWRQMMLAQGYDEKTIEWIEQLRTQQALEREKAQEQRRRGPKNNLRIAMAGLTEEELLSEGYASLDDLPLDDVVNSPEFLNLL